MKLRSAAIKLYSRIFGGMTGIISDRAYIRALYFLSFGCLPDLEEPKKFSEHICAIKLSEDTLAYRKYADKYEVRRFVARELGENYLIPMLGVYKSFDEIPFADLPKQFVLKATHASGYNIIVRDKDQLNLSAARRKFRKWLKKDYYLVGREKNYKNIRPRILAEPFLDFGSTLREYKLFCFHGQVRMICVHCFDEKGRTVTAFDPDWNPLNVKMGYPTAENMPKPNELTELLNCARILSAPFPFVRVDLYANGGQVLFSELTFTPGGGIQHVEPKEYDTIMGSWFEQKS